MASKTLQQTAAQADVQAADIIAIARGTGSLSHSTITALVTYLETILATLAAPSFTGGVTVAGGAIVTGGVSIAGGLGQTGGTVQNVSALAALDIDWSVSDFHTKSIAVNSTFTFSGITAAKGMATLLDLTISAGAVPTWPATVKWSNSITPTLGNGRHLLGFVTDDGGTTVIGVVCAATVG